MICGSGGSKSRLAKAAGAEPAGQMRDENLHAVVARSTFWSQNAQNKPFSDHFWKLRCWKFARHCGAKHILKSKCTKRTILGPLLEVEMSKKCTPLWREAHFEVKMYKTLHVRATFGGSDVEKVHAVVARSTFRSQNVQNTPCSDHFWKLRCRKSARRCGAKHISKYKTHHARTTFGSWDVEKVHAVVARSTFRSQNVQNTPCSDHFWKLRCRKSARRCGAKHISKSKCKKHHMFAPLLEVRMLKKCTPLWREAHFEVKMYKTPHVRATFGGSDVEKCSPWWREAHFQVKMYKAPHVRASFGGADVEKVRAAVARSTFPSQNVQNTTCSRHFWRFRCRFASIHYTTGHYTTLHSSTLH